MFKNEITNSPLVGGQADTVLGRISGDYFVGDRSFVATLRALVFNRMPEDEQLYFKISRSDYSKRDVQNCSDRDIAESIIMKNPRINTKGGFALHYFSHYDNEANKASMMAVTKCFEEACPGYKRLDKVTAFYQKAFPVVCFINPELKAVAMFVEQMDYRRFHYLQCSIIAVLPWYFSAEKGINELEMKLVESLMSKTPEGYNNAIMQIYKTFDFRSGIIRQKLSGFESQFIKDALANDERRYTNMTDEIQNLNRRISEVLKERNDLNYRILGMKQKIEENSVESELMEYFLANKSLALVDTYGSTITFIARTHLDYFDPEMAERAIDNSRSVLYTRNRCFDASDAQIKKLFKAIFLDETVKINVCASFTLSLDGGVATNGHYNFGPEYDDCMSHPHIDHYNCMGDYVRIINELMEKNDYIMAVEQCIASCRSLNFADSIVFACFVDLLYDTDGVRSKCLQMPDGQVLNVPSAIEWLEEHEV